MYHMRREAPKRSGNSLHHVVHGPQFCGSSRLAVSPCACSVRKRFRVYINRGAAVCASTSYKSLSARTHLCKNLNDHKKLEDRSPLSRPRFARGASDDVRRTSRAVGAGRRALSARHSS